MQDLRHCPFNSLAHIDRIIYLREFKLGRDLNPNKVKREEVDEVFLAQARQLQDMDVKKAVNRYLAAPQAQRERALREAKKIVENYKAKQAKKKK